MSITFNTLHLVLDAQRTLAKVLGNHNTTLEQLLQRIQELAKADLGNLDDPARAALLDLVEAQDKLYHAAVAIHHADIPLPAIVEL
jgi:hypothetical protein